MEKNLVKRTVLLVMVASLAIVSCAQATLYGPPIAGWTTADSSRDISLTNASPAFSADLSSYANWTGDLHTVVGYAANFGGAGQAAIQYEDQAGFISTGPYASLGRGTSGTGLVVYKFVTESGYTTAAGGTISAHVDFYGKPVSQGNKMFLGASTALTIGGALMNLQNSYTDQNTMEEVFGGDVHGIWHGTANVAVPVGVSEFYVVLADNGNTGYMSYTTLDVAANLVPEPATLLILSLGGLFIRRLKK